MCVIFLKEAWVCLVCSWLVVSAPAPGMGPLPQLGGQCRHRAAPQLICSTPHVPALPLGRASGTFASGAAAPLSSWTPTGATSIASAATGSHGLPGCGRCSLALADEANGSEVFKFFGYWAEKYFVYDRQGRGLKRLHKKILEKS